MRRWPSPNSEGGAGQRRPKASPSAKAKPSCSGALLQEGSRGEARDLGFIRGRFWIYRYDAAARLLQDEPPAGPVIKEHAEVEAGPLRQKKAGGSARTRLCRALRPA